MEYKNKLILVEKPRKNVALITLNNPPLNLVTLDLSAELREALASLAPEQAAELEKGLREVWDDPLHADMFPGGYDAKLSAD